MASIRSTNTKPELNLRAMLRKAGVTGYRVNVRQLPGKPDLAFTRWRVAVFVDGVFWHGHPDHFNPTRATPYWREKIARTQQRDRAADDILTASGWAVIRVWDVELAAKPEWCVERILTALRENGWPGRAGRRT
ncbi:DNA glycosylase [Mycobacterium sp. 1274761.0]|nr:DNA glycosylase [Mycobacterium sp. 1274761.0]